MLTKEEIQAIIDGISPLINARAKTTEILLKGEIKSAKDELRDELLAEILAARAEAKVDHLNLSSKINTIAKDYKIRIETLEEATNTPNLNKH